jgi:hypothetical protein
MTRSRWPLATLLALLIGASAALADDVVRTRLPAGHPLIGTWRIDVPNTACHELYQVRADGTTAVTSGKQVVASEFSLSAKPSARGFYKWVDKVTQDNGQPDCLGHTGAVGHVATNYLALHQSGKLFLMCQAEDLNTCIGPFVRQESI